MHAYAWHNTHIFVRLHLAAQNAHVWYGEGPITKALLHGVRGFAISAFLRDNTADWGVGVARSQNSYNCFEIGLAWPETCTHPFAFSTLWLFALLVETECHWAFAPLC